MKSLKNAFEAKKKSNISSIPHSPNSMSKSRLWFYGRKKCFSTFLNSISDFIEIFFKDFKALNNQPNNLKTQ